MPRFGSLLVAVASLWLAGCAPVPMDMAGDRAQSSVSSAAVQAAPTSGFLAGLFSPKDSRPGTPRSHPKAPVPLERVALGDGSVVLRGPTGYCIDRETLKTRGARGFAVLASCRILTNGAAGPNVAPVLITVTVGGRDSGGDLPDPQTLAAISEAPLLSAVTIKGLNLAQLATGGEDVLDGGDPRYWRGAFVQGGRLVVLALYAPKGSALVGRSGSEMLQQVRASIVAESPPGQNANGTSGG